MKKQKAFQFSMSILIFVSILFSSCQKETIEPDEKTRTAILSDFNKQDSAARGSTLYDSIQ